MPIGLPEPFAAGLGSAMAAAASAMQSGDPTALMALRAKLAEVEEENRRLRAARGKRGPAGEDDEEEDEQEAQDRKCLAAYEIARHVIMEVLSNGGKPTAEQYSERDLHLYRLSDADLQAEYARCDTLPLALSLASHTYTLPSSLPFIVVAGTRAIPRSI